MAPFTGGEISLNVFCWYSKQLCYERSPGNMKLHTQPTLILFCGLPGSGKTTLAKKLEAQGRGIRICTDEWQASIGVEHTEEDFHERLQLRLYDLAKELLDNGQDVILEDGLWTKYERDQKRADARNHGARTEMHFFDLSVEQIWERLDRRNNGLRVSGAVPISRDELERFWKLFEKPDAGELSTFDSFTVYS